MQYTIELASRRSTSAPKVYFQKKLGFSDGIEERRRRLPPPQVERVFSKDKSLLLFFGKEIQVFSFFFSSTSVTIGQEELGSF